MSQPHDRPEKELAAAEKLRLCYISNPNSSPTRHWVNWFARHGHTVCLLADVPLQEAWPEVQVIDLSKIFYTPIIRFPIWAVWLRSFLHRWHPDILHAHRVNSAGWHAAASGFHPSIVTPWDSDVFIQPRHSRLARILAWYTLRRADLITTNSKAISEQVIRLGASASRLSRVQLGIEMHLFNPSPSAEREISDKRKQLTLPENVPLVLSARAIRPIYNIEIILQTIPLVRRRFPNAIFVLTDYNTDPLYKNNLDAMAHVLGLEAAIRWLPPTSNRSDIAEIYRMSDLVVSVPMSDGTPVPVLEAMACAKPVICTDLPSLREFITDGVNGLLVPVHQIVPLAEAIIKILGQPDLAKNLGLNAYQTVSEKANYEVEMQHMETIYYQLARSRRR